MTTGAFLPIHSREALKNMTHSAKGGLFEGPGGVALSIVRACLAAGAADWVGYENVGTRKSRIEPRVRFKRRRRLT
jgi:hypothetical protein